MPSLVQIATGRSHPILRKLTSVGAGSDNDVVLGEPDVAETHALIRLETGRFLLIAPSRTWPVRVNARRVRKHVLEHGDEIGVGDALLRFNLWDEPGTLEVSHPEVDRGDVMDAYRRLADFTARLAERVEVVDLLEALLDEVVALTGADKGFLLTVDGADLDAPLRVRAARNLNRERLEATVEDVSDSIIAKVVKSRAPLIVSDALHDAQFQSSLSVVALRLCSVMCAPLVFRGDLLGVIYLGNDNVVNLFEPEGLEILMIFASQAALLMQHARQRHALQADNQRLRTALEGKRFGSLIGACDAMREVYRLVERVAAAATDISVLVLGETGTGKELIAREIHQRSARASGPFVAVNCGAIPENLLESELFGHRRGAFTGAVDHKLGSFQTADKGTLFLDEIGEMPVHLQVKLLRAIQERAVTRVGDNKPSPIDIRLIAATHVNLEQAIADGRFREDLYYRINVVSIALPPLRQRDEDVVLIARFLLERYAVDYGRTIEGLTNDAVLAIRKHAWPGNIRELENRLKKAVVLADEALISAADLDLDDDLLADRVLPLAEAKERFQRRYIDEVLALNDGNRTQTARDLGVDPRTIFRHLEKARGDDDLD